MIALAVNSVAAVEGAGQTVGAAYPILADSAHQVAEAYGVYNLLGGNVAAPAVFVINTDGRILWSYVGQGSTDRPSAQTIIEHLP